MYLFVLCSWTFDFVHYFFSKYYCLLILCYFAFFICLNMYVYLFSYEPHVENKFELELEYAKRKLWSTAGKFVGPFIVYHLYELLL